MKKSSIVAAIAVLSIGLAVAQEPPAWVPLGNLPNAYKVRDMIEVPGTDTLVACGSSSWMSQYNVWRSTNSGTSWAGVLDVGGGVNDDDLPQLARDSASGRIWTVVSGRSGANTLYYSTNNGQAWTGVAGPSTDPAVTANCIELNDAYLYFGGTIGSPYSINLYRLHQTDLTWELLVTYPECDAITQLKWYGDSLFVFCRDKDEAKVRVFTYTP